MNKIGRLCIVLIFSLQANLALAGGYEVPKGFDWLQVIDQNPELKQRALDRLSTKLTKEEIEENAQRLHQDQKMNSYKQVSGDDRMLTQYYGWPWNLCEIRDFELTSHNPLDPADKNWKVKVREYEGATWKKASLSERRTVLLIPPTGGFSVIDKAYASHFCRKYPIRVIVLVGWDGDKSDRYDELKDTLKNLDLESIDPRLHDQGAIKSMAALKVANQFAGPGAKGIMGNSVGAITSVLAASLLDDISAAGLVVGGSDLPSVIANSRERKLQVLREVRRALLGGGSESPISEEAYEAYIRDYVKIDLQPGLEALVGKSIPVKMVTSSNDVTVPSVNQSHLVEALRPVIIENIVSDKDHVGAILEALDYRQEFGEFFLKEAHSDL